MSLFAVEIKKHYRREGNKIVFRNGMTLNQLAMEMWERSGYQGVDQSALSRILNGKRLFTFHQLQVFSEILQLTETEKETLKETLAAEILHRHDTSFRPHVLKALQKMKKEEIITQEATPTQYFLKLMFLILPGLMRDFSR